MRLKRQDEAIEHLRRAAELEPDRPRYAYVYAVGLDSIGQRAKAIEVLEGNVERHPGDRESLMALINFARADGDAEDRAALCRAAREDRARQQAPEGLIKQLRSEIGEPAGD